MSSVRDVLELSRAVLANQDGFVAVLVAYMDEFGIHDNSPVLTVAAYVARPKDWRAWTKKWNAAKRPIRVFHAVDCANLKGEFKGWDGADRDKFVAKLLPVIANGGLDGVVIGIHMDEFRKAAGDNTEVRDFIGNPYAACFLWVVSVVIKKPNLYKRRIAFFHENNDYKEEALRHFDELKKIGNPNDALMSIAFGSKDDYIPLQSADILAYECNKRLRDESRSERMAWKAIDPTKSLIVARYGKHNMDKFIQGLSARISELRALGWDGTLV